MDATTKYIDSLKRRRRSPLERFRCNGARRRSQKRSGGFWTSAGACCSGSSASPARLLVCRALDHASGRAIGRHDGDAGEGQERYRGAGHRARRRDSDTWRGPCWCSATRRSRRPAWKPRPPSAAGGVEVERQRNEAARAAAAAQVKHVVDALGEGLEQLAKGALTYRITDGVRRRIQEGAGRLQRGHRAVAGDHRRDRDVGARGFERRRRDLDRARPTCRSAPRSRRRAWRRPRPRWRRSPRR